MQKGTQIATGLNIYASLPARSWEQLSPMFALKSASTFACHSPFTAPKKRRDKRLCWRQPNSSCKPQTLGGNICPQARERERKTVKREKVRETVISSAQAQTLPQRTGRRIISRGGKSASSVFPGSRRTTILAIAIGGLS